MASLQELLASLAAARDTTPVAELARIEYIALLEDSSLVEAAASALKHAHNAFLVDLAMGSENVDTVVERPLKAPSRTIVSPQAFHSLCWSNAGASSFIQSQLDATSACPRIHWDHFTMSDTWESVETQLCEVLPFGKGYIGVNLWGLMWAGWSLGLMCRSVRIRLYRLGGLAGLLS